MIFVNGHEYLAVAFVIYSVFEGEVDAIVLAAPEAGVNYMPCSWKEIAIILVETGSHHAVGRIECLFDTTPWWMSIST